MIPYESVQPETTAPCGDPGGVGACGECAGLGPGVDAPHPRPDPERWFSGTVTMSNSSPHNDENGDAD